jgi:hypothetical protein
LHCEEPPMLLEAAPHCVVKVFLVYAWRGHRLLSLSLDAFLCSVL